MIKLKKKYTYLLAYCLKDAEYEDLRVIRIDEDRECNGSKEHAKNLLCELVAQLRESTKATDSKVRIVKQIVSDHKTIDREIKRLQTLDYCLLEEAT